MRYLLFNILAVGAFYILFSGPGSVSENAHKLMQNLKQKVGTIEADLTATSKLESNTLKVSPGSNDNPSKAGKDKVKKIAPQSTEFEAVIVNVIREGLLKKAAEKKAAFVAETKTKMANLKLDVQPKLVHHRTPKIPITVERNQPTAKPISPPSENSNKPIALDWKNPSSKPQILSQDQTQPQLKAQVKSEPKPNNSEITLSEGTVLMSAKDRRRQLNQLIRKMDLVFLDRSGE
jgi:hypothetical protein